MVVGERRGIFDRHLELDAAEPRRHVPELRVVAGVKRARADRSARDRGHVGEARMADRELVSVGVHFARSGAEDRERSTEDERAEGPSDGAPGLADVHFLVLRRRSFVAVDANEPDADEGLGVARLAELVVEAEADLAADEAASDP